MNNNQEKLFKALETISNAILFLEDAQNVIKDMSVVEIKEVTEKFSEEITEFDMNDLYNTSYNFEGSANSILAELEAKLEYLDSEQFKELSLSRAGRDILIETNAKTYTIKFEDGKYTIKELFKIEVFSDLEKLLGLVYAVIVNEKKEAIKVVN